MPEERDWNAEVIAEFRANQGRVAAPYDDPPPMLLLHTIGARSGREHVVPMRCLPDGDRLYVFASAHGNARHPDWYHNVVAHPDFTIEAGAPRRAPRRHQAGTETILCTPPRCMARSGRLSSTATRPASPYSRSTSAR